MTPCDLDDLLDHELEHLPAPSAPPTLLPRVMQAVETRAHARWHRRPWVTWPAGWQVVSAAALAAVLVGLALALAGVRWPAGDLWSIVEAPLPAQAASLLRVGREVATLMRLSWEILLQPIATFVAVLVLVVSLGCAAFWTALNRLAQGGASHP